MKFLCKPISLIIIVMAFALGCSRTSPTRFYVLSPMERSAINVVRISGKISVGVGPVSIPDYLDRPQIIVRTSENRLELKEFDKWAGSLKHDVPRVISDDLSTLLGTDKVFTFPWTTSLNPKFEVKIDITRFDGNEKGEVVLDAKWVVMTKSGRKTLAMERSIIKRHAEKPGIEELVSAKSMALGELSRIIANKIMKFVR